MLEAQDHARNRVDSILKENLHIFSYFMLFSNKNLRFLTRSKPITLDLIFHYIFTSYSDKKTDDETLARNHLPNFNFLSNWGKHEISHTVNLTANQSFQSIHETLKGKT